MSDMQNSMSLQPTAENTQQSQGVHASSSQASAVAPSPATAPKPSMEGQPTAEGFDLSSYDPLQAHAMQLTASAGLANPSYSTQSPASGPVATQPTQQVGLSHPGQGTAYQVVAQQGSVPVGASAPVYQTATTAPGASGQQVYFIPQHQQTQQQQHQHQPQQQQGAQTQPQPLVYPGLFQPLPQSTVPGATQIQHHHVPQPVPAPQQAQLPQHEQRSQGSSQLVLAPLQPAPATTQPQQYYITPQGTTLAPNATLPQAGYPGQPGAQVAIPQHVGQNPSMAPSGIKRPSPGDAAAGPSQKKQQLVFTAPQLPSMTGMAPSPGAQDCLGMDADPIHRKLPPNYASMSAEEKRRYDRNIREQQRSFKISQQIKELRNVLAESNIPFKPNKFSILLNVVEYIKQLQARAIMLDAEHRKLIATIKQTSELVNSGQNPEEDANKDKQGQNVGNDAEMLFVQGLDYEGVFDQCSAALSVAALDGRILACNNEFAAVSGFSRQQLLRQSVFNLMQNHEEVFKAMGAMLSSSDQATSEASKGTNGVPMYWSGVVSQKDQNLFMNITLTRTAEGLPKFFNCALTSA